MAAAAIAGLNAIILDSVFYGSSFALRRRGVAQPGRAPGSGPGGRRFKSSLPDQSLQCPFRRRGLQNVPAFVWQFALGTNWTQASVVPTLAKNARMGHPQSW